MMCKPFSTVTRFDREPLLHPVRKEEEEEKTNRSGVARMFDLIVKTAHALQHLQVAH